MLITKQELAIINETNWKKAALEMKWYLLGLDQDTSVYPPNM